jgi:hypothetical protein
MKKTYFDRVQFLVRLLFYVAKEKALAPYEKELDREFVEEFDGMTREPVTVEQLNEIRTRFFSTILPWLTDGDQEFLIGFKKGEAGLTSSARADLGENIVGPYERSVSVQAVSHY